MPTLPRRTAATRLSPKAARHRRRQGVANIRSGGLFTPQAAKHSPDGATAHIRLTGLLLIYRPRKDERLSWPSWLTCSGRFTHIVVTRRLQAERRTGSVRRPKTGVRPTVLRFSVAGHTAWNSLPTEIRTTSSTQALKKKLKLFCSLNLGYYRILNFFVLFSFYSC